MLVGLDDGSEVGETFLQALRERGINAIAHRNETALLAGCIEQRRECQHQAIVQIGLAGDAKPVALAADCQAQLRGIDPQHAHGFALGPFHRRHGGQVRQYLHHCQRMFRVAHQPFAAALNFRVVQERQRV